MNNTDMDLLWLVINFLWSAVLMVCSGLLYSAARKLESEQRDYVSFTRWLETKQRNERKL